MQRPTNSNNAANKGYVDDVAKNKLDKQNGSPAYPQVYGVEGDVQKLYKVSDGSNISPHDNIAKYSDRGTLYSQPPEQDGDVANKEYVDNSNQSVIQIIDGIELVKINNLQYQLNVNNKPSGTIDIPKDQFLKSVSYDPDTKILTFVFTTSTGDVTTTIDMSSLVDVYVAGSGLNLSKNTFSIKLNPNENNALSLSDNGLFLDKTQFADAEELAGFNADYTAFKTNQTTINSTITDALLQIGSDIVTSEQETGAFINGQNTLKGAITKVEVQSKNLADLSKNPPNDHVTIVERTDNSITFRANSTTTSLCQEFPLEGITEGEVTASAEWVSSGTNDSTLALWWHYNGTFPNEGRISETQISGGAITAKLKKPAEDAVLYLMLYVTRNIPSVIGDTVTFTNVLVERGNTKTSWTPYLPAGTPVNITACGKNILNWKLTGGDYNSISFIQNENKTITANGTAAEREYVYILAGNTELPKGKYKFKGCPRGGSSSSTYNIHIDLYKNGTFVRGYDDIGNGVEFVINDDVNQINGYIQIFKGVTVNNIVFAPILIIDGNNKTDETYEPYESQTYTSQVGQTVDILQYDKITNIFSNTAGVAIKGKFALSTQYELNNKPVSLSGAFADRPTGTYPYVVLYTATDSGATYRLEANTDGSVSGNWISISNRLYRHNIAFNGGPGIYYYCTILTLDSEAYKTVSEIANALVGTDALLMSDGVPVVCCTNPGNNPIIVLTFFGGNTVQLTNLDGSEENISITVKYDVVS